MTASAERGVLCHRSRQRIESRPPAVPAVRQEARWLLPILHVMPVRLRARGGVAPGIGSLRAAANQQGQCPPSHTTIHYPKKRVLRHGVGTTPSRRWRDEI